MNTSYVVFVLFIQCDIAIKFHPDSWCNNRSLVPEKPAVIPWVSFHLPQLLFFFEKRWEMRKEVGLLSFLLPLWAQDCETKDPSMPTGQWLKTKRSYFLSRQHMGVESHPPLYPSVGVAAEDKILERPPLVWNSSKNERSLFLWIDFFFPASLSFDGVELYGGEHWMEDSPYWMLACCDLWGRRGEKNKIVI